MPLLAPDALAEALAAGRRGGVFFLFGEEEFLKEEAAARIVGAHLDPAMRDFNLDQFHGAELEVERLGSVLGMPPLMAEWRVVIVREAQALAGLPRVREMVEALLDRPAPGLALVLLGRIPAGSRAQLYERLKRRAVAVEFLPLGPGETPGWLMARAQAEGLDLDPEAARALGVAIGPELGVLLRELDKLRDYVGARRRVGVADVEAVVGRLPRQNRWEWFDMVGGARFAEARAALPVLLDAGETGVSLVTGLGLQFLRLALAAHGGERALEAELPAGQRWLARRLMPQARRWTPAALDAVLADLLRADRLLKSTGVGDDRVLQELLLRLEAHARAADAA